jgi:GDP-mannose 6-dehydrogenase
MESNRQHISAAIAEIRSLGKKKIGFLGMSFKAGTDDLRESPIVTAIEYLIGKGYSVSIFDRNVSIAQLMGSNKEFIEREIPHIARLMRESPEEVIADSEVLVIGNDAIEHKYALEQHMNGSKIIDLVGLFDKKDKVNGNYEGLCW